MTLPFVPGGPEPSTNGLSNFMPLTVMDRSMDTRRLRGRDEKSGKPLGYHTSAISFNACPKPVGRVVNLAAGYGASPRSSVWRGACLMVGPHAETRCDPGCYAGWLCGSSSAAG